MGRSYMILPIAVLLFLTVHVSAQQQSIQPIQANLCKWALKLKTGSDTIAGTFSVISLDIQVPNGQNFSISNLKSYSRNRDPNYVPFRPRGEDYFDFQGPCSPFICNISLQSDGTRRDPAWQLASVAANTTFLILPVKQYPEVIVNDYISTATTLRMTINLCTGSHTFEPSN